MFSISAWLLFCATETALCFTPGPAVLLVISLALGGGSKPGLQGSFGILTANAVYFALSATALGAVLVASWELFFTLKFFGAAYLLFLGARMILSPAVASSSPTLASQPRPAGAFWSGLFTQLANPKALLFFTALLPQFIQPEASVAYQIAVLGISSVVIEFLVLGLYVLATDRARTWADDPGFIRPLERIGGLFLIAAGARLVAIRRE